MKAYDILALLDLSEDDEYDVELLDGNGDELCIFSSLTLTNVVGSALKLLEVKDMRISTTESRLRLWVEPITVE